MEKISELLTENSIILELKSEDKWNTIETLTRNAAKMDELTPQQINECIDALKRREKISSTYVGNSIAIPHATIDNIDKPLLSIGISQNGILFDESNNYYAKIIVLLLVPQSHVKNYSGFLSKIATILNKSDVRNKLLHCDSKQEFLDIIKTEEQ